MSRRYCPQREIAFAIANGNSVVGGWCLEGNCQMWDKEHKDCGLKTRYARPKKTGANKI